MNHGIQFRIGVVLYYWITRCISFTLHKFSQNMQRISTWYYYISPNILINSIDLCVIDLLNFHINELITIWQVHIIILDIVIKWILVNGIGLIILVDRWPVINNTIFKRLHKCLHSILHIERAKIGLKDWNNRRPCNIFLIIKYQIRTK